MPIVLCAQNRKASNWGGKEELKRLFQKEVFYTEDDLSKGYGGKVKLSFEVDTNGIISDIIVEKSVSSNINKNAIHILKLSKWDAALENGRKVTSRAEVQLFYNPHKYSSEAKSPPDLDVIYQSYDETECTDIPKIIGYESFNKYVRENIEYPYDALKLGAEGEVILDFVIETDGRVSNLKVEKSLEANCDIVARNLIRKSRWQAGKKSGIKVRTVMRRKIYFSPNKERMRMIFR